MKGSLISQLGLIISKEGSTPPPHPTLSLSFSLTPEAY